MIRQQAGQDLLTVFEIMWEGELTYGFQIATVGWDLNSER